MILCRLRFLATLRESYNNNPIFCPEIIYHARTRTRTLLYNNEPDPKPISGRVGSGRVNSSLVYMYINLLHIVFELEFQFSKSKSTRSRFRNRTRNSKTTLLNMWMPSDCTLKEKLAGRLHTKTAPFIVHRLM